MSLSERTIHDVREVNIADVIEKFGIELKKKGANYSGCCPFHNENTPSFTVSPSKGMYKCFGCGVSGDAIKFIMEKKSLNFPEAVEYIAQNHGIKIEREQQLTVEPGKADKRAKMLTAMRAATKNYREQLMLPANSYVYQYLTGKRNLTLQTINNFKLGFAPFGPDGSKFQFLTNKIVEAGMLEVAIAAGIVNPKDAKNYDFFINRVTIPIENRQGEVISFSGRKLPNDTGEGAKYINTKNTDLYDKSRVLFGLNHARNGIKEQGCAIIVEGNFDVIKLHQCGQDNAIATCGTSLTEHHSTTLRKLTDMVIIMRDGDKAGRAAAEKDIQALSKDFSNIKMISLPQGQDPDSLWDQLDSYNTPNQQQALHFISNATLHDGFLWLCHKWMMDADFDIAKTSVSMKKCVELLCNLQDQTQRDMYIKILCQDFELKPSQFKPMVTERLQADTGRIFPTDELPKWVSVEKLYTEGFVMNYATDKDRIGIYFKGDNKPVIRLTNYVVKPLYIIMDALNSRRLIEVYNGLRTSIVEMNSKAFISMDIFETEIISKGAFYSEPGFGKMHYKRLVNWLSENMAPVHELKTLGWQSEGFFAFANKIAVPDELTETNTGGIKLLDYDDYGIAKVKEQSYLSPGVSKMNLDFRSEDNIYENDLFLKYAQSAISFKEWAELFCEVYDEHGHFGLAFIFISAFKDAISKVTKIPMPYFYGPKGSGKSAMAESMMYFFFSGKNGEGKLMSAYNLNPGQGTHFSFFSRLSRFRNVFILFNEYDPTSVEFWKKGAFKASYDGEGREIGSGDTGKKRKTEIQKVHCVPGIAGQYLDNTDDGSVMSRSVLLKFSLEKNKLRTDTQKQQWEKLNALEQAGISSLAAELYKYRGYVTKHLKDEFWSIQSTLNIDLRKKNILAEARLLNNYSLCLAMVKIMSPHLSLPFTYNEFYNLCIIRVSEHARLLKDNNVLAAFWNVIEVLFSDGQIQNALHFLIKTESIINVKEGSEVVKKQIPKGSVLYIRMNVLWDKYAKRYREVHNKTAPDADTLTVYLKDQPYFLGLCPTVAFKDSRTSAYMIDYNALQLQGVNLEKYYDAELNGHDTHTPSITDEKLEFKKEKNTGFKKKELPSVFDKPTEENKD